MGLLHAVIRAARRAWVEYRIQCAEDELRHYTDAGCAGPVYTCNLIRHIADLRRKL